MAVLRAFFAALLLAASFWALTVTPAEACLCISGMSKDRLASAELIVIGTTTEQRDGEPPPPLRPTLEPPATLESLVFSQHRIETQLRVEEYLKGSGPLELTLVSHGTVIFGKDGEPQIKQGGGADCSFVPEIDARYLFMLGAGDTDEHSIGLCNTKIRIIAGDAAALARVEEIRHLALAQGFTPSVGVSPDSGSGSDVILLFIAVGGAWVVLLSAGAFAIRRTGTSDEN